MAPHGSPAGPLRLADEGTFFVGGRRLPVEQMFAGPTGITGPGHVTVGQMYVHYRVPEAVTGPPLVLVHGSNHTGACYETTPDGREGWATYLVRQGFPVYVVDQVGRGRSGFDPMVLNDAVRTGAFGTVRAAPLFGHEAAWVNFRFGPEHPEAFADGQFPLEALEHYHAQMVPNAEDISAGGDPGGATPRALVQLLDRIGPAVLLVHSQSGPYGMEVVRQRPDAVRALVVAEGGWLPVDDAALRALHARVPTLSVFGDHSVGARGANGDGRRHAWRDIASALRAEGGTAEAWLLPELGLHGNSHMLMMDRNHLAIADRIIGWLRAHAR